jgi:hypothetical protein
VSRCRRDIPAAEVPDGAIGLATGVSTWLYLMGSGLLPSVPADLLHLAHCLDHALELIGGPS